MARDDVWTREQLIMALNVYCKIPFKDVKERHPIIQKYAPLIGRTPIALKMKVGNFGRFDPNLKARGITGLRHGSAAEKSVWEEFWSNPDKFAYESECLFAEREGKRIEDLVGVNLPTFPQGKERETISRQRVNQDFFRKTVLCAYLEQCCITGVANLQLLEACHIVSWKEDEHNRTNPKNGLCMNVMFHRAYDKHLLSITPDYEIVISEQMINGAKDEKFRNYLLSIQGRLIRLPEKFSPDIDLLARHYEHFKNQQ